MKDISRNTNRLDG